MGRLGIWFKIFILTLTIGILSTMTAVLWATHNAAESLKKQTLAHLVSIRDIKKIQIKDYFLEKLGDTKILASIPANILHLEKHYSLLSADDIVANTAEKEHKRFQKRFHAETEPTRVHMKLYDIFLIDKNGTVLHTLKEEDDLGTNLVHGKYKDTPLSEAFREGLKGPVITDVDFYSPSGGNISAFFAAPIKSRNGDVLGVLASQILMNKINEIMQERSGLGKTGETFLIGSDLMLRSDSRFFKEPTALKRRIDREAPRRALSGKTGTMWLLDYRNIPVLNAYTPVNIPGLNWGLIAKMDEAEVLAPINRLRNQIFLGTMALVLLILIISYLFSKRLVAPISNLDDKLSEMALTGEYGQTLPVVSKDEIGSLIKSFNKMSSTIKQQTLSLKDELSLRTKAEEDLKKSMGHLDEFAYVVSHDLKAPLRAISSLAGWIAEDYKKVLDDKGREWLERLLGRTEHMNKLITGILAYSRIDKSKSAKVTLHSGQIVAKVIKFLEHPHVNIQMEGRLPDIYYDETQLEQVFQNLIENAIKHIGKPKGEILISCRDTGKFDEFCVKDNGVGIGEEHFERIFKMFQYLKQEEESGSTGIGLALVKKIISRNGGNVWVESKKGEGSSFYFTVPKLK